MAFITPLLRTQCHTQPRQGRSKLAHGVSRGTPSIMHNPSPSGAVPDQLNTHSHPLGMKIVFAKNLLTLHCLQCVAPTGAYAYSGRTVPMAHAMG